MSGPARVPAGRLPPIEGIGGGTVGGGDAGSGSGTFHPDTFAWTGLGPYALSAEPDGNFLLVFVDGIQLDDTNFTIVGDQLTFIGLSAIYERVFVLFT